MSLTDPVKLYFVPDHINKKNFYEDDLGLKILSQEIIRNIFRNVHLFSLTCKFHFINYMNHRECVVTVNYA